MVCSAMSLSHSRQQFLAYESASEEGRGVSGGGGGGAGAVRLSRGVCAGFVLLAAVLCALVGLGVYYVAYYKLSQETAESYSWAWDDSEPEGQESPPPPPLVWPSYYRVRLTADLERGSFGGHVAITLAAGSRTKEIVLHSRDLHIHSHANLTQLTYEKVETLRSRARRWADPGAGVDAAPEGNTTLATLDVNVTDIKHEVNITDNFNVTDAKSNETDFVTPVSGQPSNETDNAVSKENATITETVSPSTNEPRESHDTEDTHTQVTHSSVRSVQIVSITEASGDRLIVKLASELTPHVDYILELSFEGNISNSTTGFYRSSYINSQNETVRVGVTQSFPTHARAVFPCFDSPALAARFELSVAARPALTVLANTHLVSTEPVAGRPGWQWSHFERSAPMATCLLAFALTDFKYQQTEFSIPGSNRSVSVRVWARPALVQRALYAAGLVPRLLALYWRVLGPPHAPHALRKLDLLAVPDGGAEAGAVGNWGLLTFRESRLLVSPTAAPWASRRQEVAGAVSRDLARLWLGERLGDRWDRLWINEGLAAYIEYLALEHLDPSWQSPLLPPRDSLRVLRADSLRPPLTPPTAHTLTAQNFDEVSYLKGASLLRMLNHTISGPVFSAGLREYLDRKNRSAGEDELWSAMSWAWGQAEGGEGGAGGALGTFMSSWSSQAGYPVVTVLRDYNTSAVTFHQSPFSESPPPRDSPPSPPPRPTWHIPISYSALDAGGPHSAATRPLLWLTERSATYHLDLDVTQPLYVNVDAVGHYRVNYDSRNWRSLGGAVRGGRVASAAARAQLVDDALNLAKAGLLDYGTALELTTSCISEEHWLVWEVLLTNMDFIGRSLRATPYYCDFQDYMSLLISQQLKRINYGLTPPADLPAALLAGRMVGWECDLGGDRCLDWAVGVFDEWRERGGKDNYTIPSYLRGAVYGGAARRGGRARLAALGGAAGGGEPAAALAALARSGDECQVADLLEKSLTSLPRELVPTVWAEGGRAARRLLYTDLGRVYGALGDEGVRAAVQGAARGVLTRADLDELKRFALSARSLLAPQWEGARGVRRAVAGAELRVRWRDAHGATVGRWLRDYRAAQSDGEPTNEMNSTETISGASNTTIVGKDDTGGVAAANGTDVPGGTAAHTAPPSSSP